MGNVDNFVRDSSRKICGVEDEFIQQRLEKSSIQYLRGMKQSNSIIGDKVEYLGKWDDQKNITGEGAIFMRGTPQFPSLFYEGQVLQGKAHGKGKLMVSRQSHSIYQYEGSFFENTAHTENGSKGIYQTSHIKFEGSWKKGEPKNGYLTVNGTDQKYWIKIIKFNEEYTIGEVEVMVRDHFKYKGQIQKRNNVFEIYGTGKITYYEDQVETQTYDGSWDQNLMHGTGTYQWPNGCRYEGEYSRGEKDGQGRYYFQNGDYLKGQWKDGKKEGQFVVYDANTKKEKYRNFYKGDIPLFAYPQQS